MGMEDPVFYLNPEAEPTGIIYSTIVENMKMNRWEKIN